MHPVLFLIPIIPSVACWLLIKFFGKYLFRPLQPVKIAGIKFWGIIPRYREHIVKFLSHVASSEFLSSDILSDTLTDSHILRKAMPVIEKHIDTFLNIKLKEAIPVISMFVGDRIIKQLKDLFLTELEELFPSVMSHFISDSSPNEKLEHKIAVKLNGIQIETIESKFYQTFKEDLKRIELTFALYGLIVGIFQLIIILICF